MQRVHKTGMLAHLARSVATCNIKEGVLGAMGNVVVALGAADDVSIFLGLVVVSGSHIIDLIGIVRVLVVL